MKQLLFLAVLSLALFSCTGNKKQAETSNVEAVVQLPEGTYELDNLFPVADQQIDKTITVIGYVTHVCKHAGKKCFIVGESQTISIVVNAKGEIGGFNRELVGSKLAIKGILKEGRRVSQEDIVEAEKTAKQKKAAGEDSESCETELKNIEDMRAWMKANNKDYYAFYYMDGLEFEILE